MTSTSRSVAALPLRETTQIAPFGRIRPASSRSGARPPAVGAEQDDVGVGLGPAVDDVGRAVGELSRGSRGRRRRPARPASPAGSRACRGAAWCRRVPSPLSCHAMLLVFGPRSPTYDFGPGHPLTPRRFGPGIDLLRAVGAEPGLAPEPAPDDELLWCHERRYIEIVKRFSADPFGFPEAGIGVGGDDPPFAGMHEAAAAVAGGSLRAMEAILRGDVEHAFHPGGGLHHAMPDRASGFCIYDDPALAIARARRDGLRVLYIDLDVHHGDGVQAIHAADPGVLTVSFHESRAVPVPGDGGVRRAGDGVGGRDVGQRAARAGDGRGGVAGGGARAGPRAGRRVRAGRDRVAARRRLARVGSARAPAVTTTAMGEAARLVDAVAHRFAGGRWLATGGGGYDAYGSCRGRGASSGWPGRIARSRRRRRPRGASAGLPRAPGTARRRCPSTFDDAAERRAPARRRRRRRPRRGRWRRLRSCGGGGAAAAASRATAAWWDPLEHRAGGPRPRAPTGEQRRRSSPMIDAATWDRLNAAIVSSRPRIPSPSTRSSPAHPRWRTVSVAVSGIDRRRCRRQPPTGRGRARRAAGPRCRARPPAGRALPRGSSPPISTPSDRARSGDRDARRTRPHRPASGEVRQSIARRLLERAGFRIDPAPGNLGRVDPAAIVARRG